MYEKNYTKLQLGNVLTYPGQISPLYIKFLYDLIILCLLNGWSSYAIAFKQGTVIGITNKFLQSGSTVFCSRMGSLCLCDKTYTQGFYL